MMDTLEFAHVLFPHDSVSFSALRFSKTAAYEFLSPHLGNLPSTIGKYASRSFEAWETLTLLGAHGVGIFNCNFYDLQEIEEPDLYVDFELLSLMISSSSFLPSQSPSPSISLSRLIINIGSYMIKIPVAVTNFERRGRKRRRKFEKNARDVQEPGCQPKKRAIEIRGLTLGKMSSYDSGLYRVDYEDGDCEDLDSPEICQFLIADEYFDDELLERRKKLDKCLEKNRAKVDLSKNVDVGDVKADVNRVELTTNGLPDKTQADGSGTDDDVDSYSNSSECSGLGFAVTERSCNCTTT